MMSSNAHTWVTIAEAAERSGLSKKAIRSRIERGTVLHRKGRGGLRLVSLEALIASPDDRGRIDELHEDAGAQPRADDQAMDVPTSHPADRGSAGETGSVTVRLALYEIVGPVDAVVATCRGLVQGWGKG